MEFDQSRKHPWVAGMPSPNPGGKPKGIGRLRRALADLASPEACARVLYAVAFEGAWPKQDASSEDVIRGGVIDVGGRLGVSDELRMAALKLYMDRMMGTAGTYAQMLDDDARELARLEGGSLPIDVASLSSEDARTLESLLTRALAPAARTLDVPDRDDDADQGDR